MSDVVTYYFLPKLGLKVLVDDKCPLGSIYFIPEITINFDDIDKLDKVEEFINVNIKKFGLISNMGE